MRKLWFNQMGEDVPDIAIGDMLDKYDSSPNLRHIHPFGFDDLNKIILAILFFLKLLTNLFKELLLINGTSPNKTIKFSVLI